MTHSIAHRVALAARNREFAKDPKSPQSIYWKWVAYALAYGASKQRVHREAASRRNQAALDVVRSKWPT